MARSASTVLDANGMAADAVEPLEQRVRRLEHAVAAMQDTQLMEDRVVERVVHRVDHLGSNGMGPIASTAGLLASASKILLPKRPDDVLPNDVPSPDTSVQSKPAWLFLDLIAEFRTMVGMFYDYRFRLSWTGRIVPLAGLIVYLLSWLLLSSGVLGLWGFLDRIVAMLVAIVVYKALSREAARYNDLLSRLRYR